MKFDDLPDDAVLRIADVLAVTGYSRSVWYLGVKEGRFPKPVKLGARAAGWRVVDIRRVLKARSLL